MNVLSNIATVKGMIYQEDRFEVEYTDSLWRALDLFQREVESADDIINAVMKRNPNDSEDSNHGQSNQRQNRTTSAVLTWR
jgi:hypothetical protein